MEKITTLIFLISFIPFILCEDCECPSIKLVGDFKEIQKYLSQRFYNYPFDHANPNTEKILEMLSELVDSENDYQRNIAYNVALWLSVFMRHSKLPQFCAMAQVINATVSKDEDEMRVALEAAANLHQTLSIYRQYNSIVISKCEQNITLLDTITYKPGCCGKGFVYDLDVLWHRRENVLPSGYYDVVCKLYESDFVLDKLIALCLTYSITEVVQKFYEQYPLDISYQATSLQYGCKIPTCCCKKRLEIVEMYCQDTADASRDILLNLIPKCDCPKLCVNPDDYKEFQLKATLTFLKNAPVNLSPTGTNVRNILCEMAESNNKKHNNIAVGSAFFYYVLTKNIDKLPSLCVFALLINATVAYEARRDNSEIAYALNGVLKFDVYFSLFTQNLGIAASGCDCQSSVTLKTEVPSDCYKNGFVYHIKPIWNSKEKLLPPDLGKAVCELYTSRSYLERIFALVITTFITDFADTFWKNFDTEITFKIISSLLSEEIPKCCCSSRVKELSELTKKSFASFREVIEISKKNCGID